MFLHRWKTLLLLTLALSGLACTKNPDVAAPPKAPAPPAAPVAAAAPASAGSPLTGIPGMDFSALPPSAQRELATVFSDEFCYCGCPHTLGACLKTHTGCKHGRRMARLAARQVAAGTPAPEVILGLGQYYASFRDSRAALKVDERMCQGEASAPVTLVEFSDFECPACARARPLLEDFARKHAAQVRFCYAPFPLAMHPNALPAAQAALWARDQGQFWPMHDALFAGQRDLSLPALKAMADGLGLNGAKLLEALKAGAYLEELGGYRAQGDAARVRSTPSIYLNGHAYPLDFLGLEEANLLHAAEDEAEWGANNNAWAAD